MKTNFFFLNYTFYEIRKTLSFELAYLTLVNLTNYSRKINENQYLNTRNYREKKNTTSAESFHYTFLSYYE